MPRTARIAPGAAWPVDRPANWHVRVNPTTTHRSWIRYGGACSGVGPPEWQKRIAKRLGLESVYRPTGCPRKIPYRDGIFEAQALQWLQRIRPVSDQS
ncbi:MAG TPA: hypothetical protein VGG64_21035 [Pirellulales bacterium]|jgi:hypothetical protein